MLYHIIDYTTSSWKDLKLSRCLYSLVIQHNRLWKTAHIWVIYLYRTTWFFNIWSTMTGWWFGTFGLFFPSYWEFHHPNGRTPWFFRGVGLNHQPDDIVVSTAWLRKPGWRQFSGRGYESSSENDDLFACAGWKRYRTNCLATREGDERQTHTKTCGDLVVTWWTAPVIAGVYHPNLTLLFGVTTRKLPQTN